MQNFQTNQFPFGAINLTVISLSVNFSVRKLRDRVVSYWRHTRKENYEQNILPRMVQGPKLYTNIKLNNPILLNQFLKDVRVYYNRTRLWHHERDRTFCVVMNDIVITEEWLTVRNELVPQNTCCYRRGVASSDVVVSGLDSIYFRRKVIFSGNSAKHVEYFI